LNTFFHLQPTAYHLLFLRLHPSSFPLPPSVGWPISSLEIHRPICYAHRFVALVFFGNPTKWKSKGRSPPLSWKNRDFDTKKIRTSIGRLWIKSQFDAQLDATRSGREHIPKQIVRTRKSEKMNKYISQSR